MFQVDSDMFVVGSAILGTLFTGVTTVTVVSRFYRRCGADEALVRTGSGGNKVVIGGGILVYPILHQLLRVSLRSVKLSVERSGKNALVTADKIKANVTTELYIKVEPIAEDVLAAARSFGERNLDEHAIGDLIEGKLTDALRSVAANQTFMSLHGKRKEFAEHIQAALAEELKKNGLTLENVSITALAMVPVKDLDEHDVFDAEGLRAITESVQTNREKTNQIQRDKENQIHAANVGARMRALELEQNQKQAEADQARRVAEYSSIQQAETAKAVYLQEQAMAVALAAKQKAEREAQIAGETGQQAAEIQKQRVLEAQMIEKETIVQAKEIERQKALEAATIDKEKVVNAALVQKEQALEVARIEKTIAVTKTEEEQARAAALKALALAEEEKARQAIVTVEETARAERAKQIAVIQAEAEAEVKRALGEGEAAKAKGMAEAALSKVRGEAQARVEAANKEAEALERLAQATIARGAAEAEARRKMVEADNQLAMKFVLREIALKAIETMPAIARELMEPAKAITEIKVLQTNGGVMGAGAQMGGGQPMGMMSPILKTILEAGAAYPLMRELMSFAQVDSAKLSDKARGVIAELGSELEAVVKEPTERKKGLPSNDVVGPAAE
jgi:flotillin